MLDLRFNPQEQDSCRKPNQYFNDCGSACDLTCEDVRNDIRGLMCVAQCIKKCSCISGYLMKENGDCAFKSDCKPVINIY